MKKLLIILCLIAPLLGQNLQLHYELRGDKQYITSTLEQFTGDKLGLTYWFISATYTDFDGKFTFENIKPGEYKLVTNYISYKKGTEILKVNNKENENDYLLTTKVKTYAINISMNDLEDDVADNSMGCTVVDVRTDEVNPDGSLKDDTFQDIEYDIRLTGVIKTIISKEEIIETYDKDNQDYKVLIDVPKGGPELYEGLRTKVNGWYSGDVDENGNTIILSEGGLIRVFE